MRVNLRILAVILSLIFLAATMSRSQSLAQDPDLPDTLYVDSTVAFSSGSGVVPVSIFNDEELAAIEITLKHDSPQVKIDSFSFVGGRLEYLSFRGYDIVDDNTITIYAVVLDIPQMIPAGSGAVGSLYCSWNSGVEAHAVDFDTTTVLLPDFKEKSTTFKQDGSDPFIPQYVPGSIDIQVTPLVMDSIWITDTIGHPGQMVTVDVNLFNERNLARVSVALAYGAGELHFEEATFENTRGGAATTKSIQKNHTFSQLWMMLTFGDASPLPPGSGTLAHLHFTVAAEAPEMEVSIVDEEYLSVGATFVDLTATDGSIQIVPFFNPGTVNILIPTDVQQDDQNLPSQYELGQNYPNPFNPETIIRFALPTSELVRLEVFNILGQSVRTLANDRLPAGNHKVIFDGRSDTGSLLATGVYYYRFSAGDFSDTNKMLLLK